MKKYLGAIISIITAALTIVFLSIPQFVVKISMNGMNQNKTFSGWELFDKQNNIEFQSMGGDAAFAKFSVIALASVAGLLLTLAIIIIIKNALKKDFNLNLVNNLLLILHIIVSLMTVIALFALGTDMKSSMPAELLALIQSSGGSVMFAPTLGAWLNVVVGIFAPSIGWIFAKREY